MKVPLAKEMKSRKVRAIWAVGLCVFLAFAGPVAAEDLAAAVAAGKVTVSFRGNGGSSGDAIEVEVEKTAKSGDEPITLTVTPGTRLQSREASAQNMVLAGVRGCSVGGDSFAPASAIQVSGDKSATYILEGYCMDFEKDNPSSDTGFSINSPDPVLASILNEADGLSTVAKQAAVWIYTDQATYAHVNQKFDVRKSDWTAAEAAVKKALAGAGPSKK